MEEVMSKMLLENGFWKCLECNWLPNKNKARVFDHVEAMHVETGGYTCPLCEKFCPSYASLKMHKSRYHKYSKDKFMLWINDKCRLVVSLYSDTLEGISEIVLSKMIKEDRMWKCLDCEWQTQYKTRLFEHVEAKHVETDGYMCKPCGKHLPSIKSWNQHKFKYHK